MSKRLVNILDLHCCQMALGMLEVKEKVKEFSRMSKSEFLKNSIKEQVIIAICREKKMFIVDGQHRALAALLSGQKKIFAKVKIDFSKRRISRDSFWRRLQKKNCVHLFDQFGCGPHEPLYLPVDVRGLGDDPYRSLAWLAKQNGAFKDRNNRFSDFKWANFFRKRKLLKGKSKKDFKTAAKNAVRLSHSTKARHLPGYKRAANVSH